MRRIPDLTGIIFFAILSFALLLPVQAESRPTCGKLSLPYPTSIPHPTPTDSLLFGFTEPFQQLTLHIDEFGALTSVTTDVLTTVPWQTHLKEYLSRIPFEPGEVKGKKLSTILPVRLFIDVADSSIALEFPIDTTGTVVDYFAYSHSLEMNGVKLPDLVTFPWYHAVFPNENESRTLPFVLGSLSFDKSGRPKSISLVKTNFPAFAGQILSAANYATYSAGRALDSTRIASGFLLVTLFPTSHYPTKPWNHDWLAKADLHDRLAVRFIADTAPMLIPPLPISRTSINLGLSLPRQYKGRGAVVRIRIDETGNVRTFVSPSNESELYPIAMALENQLHFYPATFLDGKKRIFDSAVVIRSEGASGVRISFPWLP